jgi:hypothetical protein
LNINIKLAHCFIASWCYYTFDYKRTFFESDHRGRHILSFLDVETGWNKSYSTIYYDLCRADRRVIHSVRKIKGFFP